MGVVRRAVLFSSGRNSKERVLFYCCDTLRNPNMGSDRTYISSSVSSFSPCLPGDPCSSPSASFVLAPSEVGLVSETTQLWAHSVILLSNQKHSIWCLDSEPVCHLPRQPALLHLDWPHNESWELANHVGPDVPPQVCRVKEKHLVTVCFNLAAVWQTRHDLLTFCKTPHDLFK